MIRGLFIRQIFVLIDLALALVITATLVVVAMKFLEAPQDISAFAPGDAAAIASDGLALRVAERTRYDSIKVFGASGNFDPGAVVEEVEVDPGDVPPPPTTLNLQLVGTTASKPKDPAASAIIVNLDNQAASGTFLVGQPVIHDETAGDVVLLEVFPTEVVLLNKQTKPESREKLSMQNAAPSVLPGAGTKTASNTGAESGSNRITINREEFVQDLYTNYAELVTSIRPEYYRDAQGNVVGLTAQNISKVPLAQKLGLSDGDVLQSINNESIDSEQKVMELFQRYRDSSAFRIGILRNGVPQVITYRLE